MRVKISNLFSVIVFIGNISKVAGNHISRVC